MGDDGDTLFPPDPHALGARVACQKCGEDFPLFEFPLTATLGGMSRSVSVPVPERTEKCPACGEPVVIDVDE